MRNKGISIILFLIIIVYSCRSYESYFKPGFHKFKMISFEENANYLLIHNDFGKYYEVIDNQQIIKDHYSDFSVYVDRECLGTTPDFQFCFYKNGEELDKVLYCGWNLSKMKFGKLKDYFKKAIVYQIESYDKTLVKKKLDSLRKVENVFFLSDTVIPKHDGVFRIYNIIDSTDLSYEEALEEEKRYEELLITKTNEEISHIKVKAHSFSPDGVTKFWIENGCSKEFYNSFVLEELNNILEVKTLKKGDYKAIKYRLEYLKW